jgi:hypothetical protein
MSETTLAEPIAPKNSAIDFQLLMLDAAFPAKRFGP